MIKFDIPDTISLSLPPEPFILLNLDEPLQCPHLTLTGSVVPAIAN